MRRRSSVSALVALVLTLSGLAGCGGDPGAGPAAVEPAPVVTTGPALYGDVFERMVEAGTAQFVFSGTGGGQPVSGAATIRFEAAGYQADVELSLPETGAVRAILAPEVSYLALPPTKGLPTTKPWLKVAPGNDTPLARRLRPVVDQLRSTFDPAMCVGLLRAAGQVKALGPATVEGVSTTHYRADIAVDRIIRMAEDHKAAAEYVAMREVGISTLRFDVWVDVSGLPRRYRVDFPRADGVYSVTGVYRDWGRIAEVAIPKDKAVFDASKLKG